VSRLLDCDEALLSAIYQAGGNQELVNLIQSLWQRLRPYKFLAVAFPQITDNQRNNKQDKILEWATGIAEACMAKDGGLAAERVRLSLEEANSIIMQYMTDVQDEESTKRHPYQDGAPDRSAAEGT
jgi:DNA-binding GntR family transcriptional regulator